MKGQFCWIKTEIYCQEAYCQECQIYQQAKGIAYDYLSPIHRAQLNTTRPDVVRDGNMVL